MNKAIVGRALVVGGGLGGMATAILLRRLAVDVTLVEIDPQWGVSGAGLTCSPVTFRALAQLGCAREVLHHGAFADAIETFDADGRLAQVKPLVRLAGPELPSMGGIMRPVLRQILADATVSAGTEVRLGSTVAQVQQDADAAHVIFSDGRRDRFDLVIGADGVRSQLRRLLFPGARQPVYTGQACWRAVLPRPAEVRRPRTYMGLRHKAGLNPVSATEMYLYLNHPEPEGQQLPAEALPGLLAERLRSYGGLMGDIGRSLDGAARILYRPLDRLLLPPPWYRGRVLLIGDAVHATTPHLGAGAGAAIEDALVLAEEIGRAESLAQALERFMQRRFERCRLVVDCSARLGELEQQPDSHAEHSRLFQSATAAIAAPY